MTTGQLMILFITAEVIILAIGIGVVLLIESWREQRRLKYRSTRLSFIRRPTLTDTLIKQDAKILEMRLAGKRR